MARLGVGLSGRVGGGSQWSGWGWVSVAWVGVGLSGRDGVGLTGREWVGLSGRDGVGLPKQGRDGVGLWSGWGGSQS